MCDQVKEFFDYKFDDHKGKGGVKQMGEGLRKGMVLVLSLWDDCASNMLWLDGVFPPGEDATIPGIERGPCPADSGIPSQVEELYGNAVAKVSNIKFGPIGSTY